MIVISDIHGREFWEKALIDKGILSPDRNSLNEDVLFMGDYLDHYDGELNADGSAITAESEYNNFLKIIEFKKKFGDKVTLLLGNHDAEYISDICPGCRVNYRFRNDIVKAFRTNLKLFCIGAYVENEGKLVTFTHANICASWIYGISSILEEASYPAIDTKDGKAACCAIIDYLNDIISKEDTNLLGRLICHVGFDRGGYTPAGSIVWADMTDYVGTKNDIWDDVYQVVAHTQHIVSSGRFAQVENLICTDCHIETRGNRPLFRFEPGWRTIGANKKYLTCLSVI